MCLTLYGGLSESRGFIRPRINRHPGEQALFTTVDSSYVQCSNPNSHSRSSSRPGRRSSANESVKKYRPPKANFGYGYGGKDFVVDDEFLEEGEEEADEEYQVSRFSHYHWLNNPVSSFFFCYRHERAVSRGL